MGRGGLKSLSPWSGSNAGESHASFRSIEHGGESKGRTSFPTIPRMTSPRSRIVEAIEIQPPPPPGRTPKKEPDHLLPRRALPGTPERPLPKVLGRVERRALPGTPERPQDAREPLGRIILSLGGFLRLRGLLRGAGINYEKHRFFSCLPPCWQTGKSGDF